jgi:hypothetical protein
MRAGEIPVARGWKISDRRVGMSNPSSGRRGGQKPGKLPSHFHIAEIVTK